MREDVEFVEPRVGPGASEVGGIAALGTMREGLRSSRRSTWIAIGQRKLLEVNESPPDATTRAGREHAVRPQWSFRSSRRW